MRTVRLHERFLRHVWSRQNLRAAQLRTTDGRPIVVVDPGVLNLDAGPDFRNARIRIGGTLFAGDVEIHRTVVEWLHHRHGDDPRYNGVILHVVLDRPAPDERSLTLSGRELPLLVLGDALGDTLRIIWQETILDERSRRRAAIPCADENEAVPLSVLAPWLDHLEAERLEIKLRRFEERLRELAVRRGQTLREAAEGWPEGRDEPPDEGPPDEIPPPVPDLSRMELAHRPHWDQLLYEGILEGLGYSKNRRPFIRLSQALTLDHFRAPHLDGLRMEAAMFGAAGLLPDPNVLADPEAQSYARTLAEEWRAFLVTYRNPLLGPTDWVFAPTRPQNGPHLRLVAARSIAWKLLREDLFRTCMDAVRSTAGPVERRRTLHALLEATPGPFWDRRWSFERRANRIVHPLGASRKDDLIVNAVIPLGLLYARLFRSRRMREGALRLLHEYPPTQPNTITLRMDRQLIRGRIRLDTAGRHQAVIQLYKYYCEEERCEECAVGKFLWQKPRGPK